MRSRRTLVTSLLSAALTLAVAVPAGASAVRVFPSADAAVAALVDAAKRDDREALHAIFGPGAASVFTSGDPVADREAYNRFVARAGERTHLQHVGDDFAVLSVGNDDWPFAIPLMKGTGGWIFDVDAGRVELLNRRIGRNELDTIQVFQDYAAAQRDYARRRQRADGVAEYAQHLRSTPGKRDGLYWEVKAGEEESPIGPLIASASAEGYRAKGDADPAEPFHGYIYRALRAAGPHAPGGARSYIKDGRMTGGFASARLSGALRIERDHDVPGERERCGLPEDLGPRTDEIAAGITAYDPDDSWNPTE